MLSEEQATALVLASRLFDEQWYAGLAGRSFASREDAAAHWVGPARPDGASPHPLFEPDWLYPGGRWRTRAPDPLSFYLSRPEDRRRSPHPCYDHRALGPLEAWLDDHEVAEVLVATPPRAATAEVAEVAEVAVRVPTGDLLLAVRWVRHLASRSPEVTVVVEPRTTAQERVLGAVAAALPRVVVGPVAAPVVVDLSDGVTPPVWDWLTPLLAPLDRPGVVAARSLLLRDDFTVAAPVLVGHPVSAVERLDGAPLPAAFPGALARRTGAPGDTVLAAEAWLVGPAAREPDPAFAELEAAARRVEVVEGTPSLRWSIDIAAGAAPIGRRWGDWHFARSLADALERLGQWVEIDHPETRGRSTRAETDVVLTLRGLERVAPAPGATNLLWVISHPAEVSDAELASYDIAFAASTTWAAARAHLGVVPLLQCTDATRFHPGVVADADLGAGGVLFVGNARGGIRPVVAAARDAGLPIEVVGTGWAEHGVDAAADRIANVDLPAAYASAGIVLGDHWEDMRELGFVSNRVFDVLAVAGRLLTDPVAGLTGLAGLAGADLPCWREPADLARLAHPPYDAPDGPWPGTADRLTLASRVVAEHSFDARAATLLAAALRLAARGGDREL